VNTDALAALAQNAKAFARCYVAVVEELVMAGVPELQARRDARAAAVAMSMLPNNEKSCALCGRSD
jgi:hypothetical protein